MASPASLEAKEGVPIQDETKISASITYQNSFRMYKKLSGMTGTGKTEEEEFVKFACRLCYSNPKSTYPVQRTTTDFYGATEAKLKAAGHEDVMIVTKKVSQSWLVQLQTSDYISKKLI